MILIGLGALVCAGLVVVALSGGVREEAGAVERLQVVATTTMIADAARAIAGDRAEVTALMGPGVDPHLYRQTSSDVAKLARADLVLHNGLYLEAQLEPLLRKLAGRQSVVPVGEAIPAGLLLDHPTYRGKIDPHVWMNPVIWRYAVEAIRDALIAADPVGRPAYDANAARYVASMERLAAYAKSALETVPERNRVLITAHDAFGYFGLAYGFDVLGVQGLSTESEAGLKRIEQLVAIIVERKVDAIFVESSVSERNIKALIEGAAAAGHEVRLGGQLFSDAMGTGGTYEGTYAGMIDHNATTIANALGGDAPARGMLGRLGHGS